MKKAVIFDMDGVLIDSQPFHFQADIETLKRCGYPAALADVVGYAGMASVDRWAKYKKDYQLADTVEQMIARNDAVKEELLETTRFEAIAGIPELLALLRDKGIRTAVASSSSVALIDHVLAEIGLAHCFDVTFSGEQMKNSKPAPDVFLATAEALGVTPDECVVIEDSHNGVQAAYHAGMRCVAYRNPSSGDQDLSLADWKIDHFFMLIHNNGWLV